MDVPLPEWAVGDGVGVGKLVYWWLRDLGVKVVVSDGLFPYPPSRPLPPL